MKFLIKKGRHYANNLFRLRVMFGRKLKFRYRIPEEAMYDPGSVINGWSKVFGMAEPVAHWNSIRLVWQCTSAGMRAGLYTYISGVSPQDNPDQKKDIGCIYPGHWYKCYIKRVKNGYIVYHSLDIPGSVTHVHGMPGGRWWFPVRFLLHPYVGGRFTLDNDITIEVELLK